MLTIGPLRDLILSDLQKVSVNKYLLKMMQTLGEVDLRKELYFYQKRLLNRIKDRSDLPFTRNNAEHEDLLLRLWDSYFPRAELTGRISDQWQRLGFQVSSTFTYHSFSALFYFH